MWVYCQEDFLGSPNFWLATDIKSCYDAHKREWINLMNPRGCTEAADEL